MIIYKEERKKANRSIQQIIYDINEQFGKKKNQVVIVNKKLFWKELGKRNGGKDEDAIE